MIFDNPDSLLAAIADDMENVVNNVGKQYSQTVRDYVQAYVYDPYTPSLEGYHRTHQFYESWVFEYERSGLLINGKIFSNPDLMVYLPPIHGRAEDINAPMAFMDDYGAKDRRAIMDRIVAIGSDYDYTSPNPESNWWTRPRDYFTPALGEMDATFDSAVRIQIKKLGINII